METKDVVFKILKESKVPMKSAEVASKAGIDKPLVDKAIQALKKEEKIVSPKACYYQPR